MSGARRWKGPALGLTGVVIFSLALPVTTVGVRELDPAFLTTARAVVAGLLACLVLALSRSRRPQRAEWRGLAVVAAGAVIGSPLLTSISLQHLTASHAAVVCATLPAATAVLVVLRTRERPGPAFWLLAGLGALAAVAFAGLQQHGTFSLSGADVVLLGAVACSAVGYSEGALVSRTLGAWQTICWSLVIAGPVTLLACLREVVRQPPEAGPRAWLAVAYLGVFGMVVGYFAWYSGLAAGPIAQVSQTQLVQPVLTLGWAVLLLGETLTPALVLAALAVAVLSGFAATARGPVVVTDPTTTAPG